MDPLPQDFRFFAHSTDDPTKRDWHSLADHLSATGTLAATFGEAFGDAQLARTSGLLHDLGKYTQEFQARIEGQSGRVDHSTWGARIAIETYGLLGQLLAYGIAGHHAGLANGVDSGQRTALRDRLGAPLPKLCDSWKSEVELPAKSSLGLPLGFRPKPDRLQFQQAFLGRMVYSCLVDADYLDTERFYAQASGSPVDRDAPAPELVGLREALESHLASFDATSPINALRGHILGAVRAKHRADPGLFTLTVPTGGGKTLASLAFALDHAIHHGLTRIIYVIPFTSIVEQTAAVFRRALGELGDRAVLEHHSTYFAPSAPSDDPDRYRAARKLQLATENWDAPIIVTTSVQFLESLFTDRPSGARKLHRIAKSVVVIDEAQTLPLKLMRPTLAALDELIRNYRATIVLCTATQPVLSNEDGMPDGLMAPRELAPDPTLLHGQLRRVNVRHLGETDDSALAALITGRDQVLCVVNNRRHARYLFDAIRTVPGARHLTTLMCAAHRREVLDGIRRALRDVKPCRVVSTSLIEAGVDVDFPMVLRAEAGLDSIAQAAGRCNREGRHSPEASDVLIFSVADDRWAPPPELRQFAQVARSVLRNHGDDPLSPEALGAYFRELYWQRGLNELDAHGLLDLLRGSRLESLPFETLAQKYRVIESVQQPIVIPYSARARELIRALNEARSAHFHRELQSYLVQVPRAGFDALRRAGALAPIAPERFGDQFMLLIREDLYNESTGLSWDDAGFMAGESLCW